jgi:hypothetical protein
MRNAWATLIFNIAHIPVDIYHIYYGRKIFIVFMLMGVFLIVGALTYIHKRMLNVKTTIANENGERNIIHSALPEKQLGPIQNSLVKSERRQGIQRSTS